jgi:hypothetical protein
MEKQNIDSENNNYFKKNKVKINKIVKEYENATTKVVFIATRTDIAVLMGYIIYYFFMGKIVNRPKYVTDLGKLIVFPIPSALGAFAGYKLSYVLLHLI